MARIQSYRDIVAWQKAVDYAVDIYALTRTFPRSEIFGVSSQLQRAAVSVATNIAEGHSRSTQAYLNHLSIADGSLKETETILIIGNRVGFSKLDTHLALLREADEIGRLLKGLMKGVERSRG